MIAPARRSAGGAAGSLEAPEAGLLDRFLGSLWLQAILALALHRWLWPRTFGGSHLRQESYFEPFLTAEILSYGRLLALVAVPTLLFALLWRRLAWRRLDDSGRLRWTIFAVAGLSAWLWATLPYNLYYGTSHVYDRLLLLALWGLILVHPLFVHPFTALALVIAMQLQHPLPEGGWMWPDKRLPADALILFTCFLLVAALAGRRTRKGLPLLLLLGLTGAHYLHAGINKLRLGPEPWSWLTDNHLSHLIVTSYLHGDWLGFLGPERIAELAARVRTVDLPLAVFSLAVELSGIALGWSLGLGRKLLLGFVALHLGILLASGIFFWMWIAFDLILLVAIAREREREREGEGAGFALGAIPRWQRAVLVAAIALTGSYFFYNVPFAWRDTPYVNRFVITATGEDGRSYRLDGDAMAPYDVLFTQSRFFYLTARPLLTDTYGTTHRPGLAEALDRAAPGELPALRERYGRSAQAAGRARRFERFFRRFVASANGRGGPGFWLHALAPPNHFQGWRPADAYTFQTPIASVEVELVEQLFDGERIVPIHRESVLELAGPELAGAATR